MGSTLFLSSRRKASCAFLVMDQRHCVGIFGRGAIPSKGEQAIEYDDNSSAPASARSITSGVKSISSTTGSDFHVGDSSRSDVCRHLQCECG